MSVPTILPSGQLHPDLVNNAAFVKYVNGGATGPEEKQGKPSAAEQTTATAARRDAYTPKESAAADTGIYKPGVSMVEQMKSDLESRKLRFLYKRHFTPGHTRGWEKCKEKPEDGVHKGHGRREDTDAFIRDAGMKEPERPKYGPGSPQKPVKEPESKPADTEKPSGSNVPAVPQETAPTTQSGAGRYKLTIEYTSLSVGYASGSYSKNDALLESLREKYGDEAAIQYAGGDLSKLSGEELAALEQEFQLSGQSSVMWGSYTKITIEMTFDSMEELEARLGESVDILCAAHEAQGSILPRHYSGKELAEQTGRMESLFRESMERITDTFADFVGGFLDANGALGQGEKIRMSVQSLFVSYQSKYQSISQSSADPTGTIGTKDAWLGSHFGYLTSSLLRLGKGVDAPAQEEGLYSLQELQFAAMSVTAWQSSITKASQGGGGSEVRQALTVSMISMKLEVASARGVIGKDMEDALRGVQDSANKKVLDAMDKHHARWREERGDDEDWGRRFPDCDRDLFSRVYQKVMDSFRLTGDAMGAIREGAAMAKPELTRAIGERGPAHRWENEMAPHGYWDSFYGGAYGEGGFQSFVNDWNGFMGKLGASGDWDAKA